MIAKRRFIAALLCAALALPGLARLPAAAQEGAPGAAEALAARRAETLADIEALAARQQVSAERLAALNSEIDALRRDENLIAAALIQSGKTEKKLNADIAALGAELAELATRRDAVNASLQERGLVLSEVLAALQRMGLNPPPALLVRPDDALASVRSAIMLGSVVPEMRQQTLALRAALDSLIAIIRETDAKESQLRARLAAEAEERKRYDLLLAEKKRLAEDAAGSLAEEERANAALAANAGSLKELLDQIDRKIADVETAAAARRSAIARAQEQASSTIRLEPAARFAEMRGRLTLPVRGTLISRFGEKNASGFVSTGDTIATRSGAIVLSPVDAVVAFAAPFRSYGRMVILDVGDGYKMVMTGLGELAVLAGQTVLAGEPLGTITQMRVASAAATGIDMSTPELYVELRKGNTPLDPAGWWLTTELGMVGNDT